MATDWAADVKKYAPKADDAVIAGIVRYCGIALTKVDSSLVAFSDPKELERVRNNFLKKKLGLTQADKTLDAAIAKVGEAMKADRIKNRVTVYYLLAANYKKLGLFAPKAKAAAKAPAKRDTAKAAAASPVAAKAPAKSKAEAKAAPAKKAAAVATTKKAPAKKTAIKTAPPQPLMDKDAVNAAATEVAPTQGAATTTKPSAPAASAAPQTPSEEQDSGLGWLWWVIGLAVLLYAIWYLFMRDPSSEAAMPESTEAAAAAAAATASETAELTDPVPGETAPAE